MLDAQTPAVATAAVSLTSALGPAFAAGFAVQRLLELLDSLLSWRLPLKDDKGDLTRNSQRKKVVLSLVSLGLGMAIARACGLHVIQSLEGLDTAVPWDPFLTGLIISAGTEGLNSIVKFVGYAKEAQKGAAAQRLADSPASGLRAVAG